MPNSSADISQIINIIEHFLPLSTSFKRLFGEMLHFEFKQQGWYLLNQKEHQLKIWFLINGSARAFKKYDHSRSNEQTLWFWFKNEIIINPKFYDNLPSSYFIELLEDSHLAYIDITSLQAIDDPAIIQLLAKIRMHYEKLSTRHYEHIKRKTKQQLYDDFLQGHPDIFNHVKIKDVASFLGMAADTIYKLRRKSG